MDSKISLMADTLTGTLSPVDGTLTGTLSPAAVGGDKFFQFDQMTASDTWTIEHRMNKFPSVTVVDSGGNVVIGDVRYTSKTSITIAFNGSFSGTAYLN